MKKLKATDTEVIEVFRTGNADQRKTLTELFGPIETGDDMKQVWENFLKENKLEHKLPHTWEAAENDTLKMGENTFSMLQLIVKHENGGWTPDWNNGNQRKWFPVFDMDDSTGFGFSRAYYVYWRTVADVGSRLCFQTEQKAVDTAKKYILIYKRYLYI